MPINHSITPKNFFYFLVFILMSVIFLAFAQGCNRNAQQKPAFKTEYQAVFLVNGQVYFGKLENADSPYPILRDVYYIQRQVDKDSKEAKGVLVKRVNDWHGPDYMYINSKQIAIMEPVSPTSKVGQLIKEAKGKDEKK